MRKLLKVLSVIVLILFVVAALGLFVPSLLGVETVIVGNQVDTNLQAGTVIYGQHLPVEEFENGGTIIYTTDDCAYEYEVKAVDINAGEVTVHDDSNGSDTVIQTRKNLVKKVIAIPFIGYLYIATQSTLGLIVLGCLAGAILLFFIFGCIIDSRDDDDFFGDDGEEDNYFSGIATNMKRPHSVDSIPTGPSASDTGSVRINIPADTEAETVPGLEINDDEKFNTAPEVIIREAGPEEDYFTDGEDAPKAKEIQKQLSSADKAVKAAPVSDTKAAAVKDRKDNNENKASGTVRATAAATAGAKAGSDRAEEYPEDETVIQEEGSAYGTKNISTSELPDMEAALEAALSTTQLNRTQQMKPVQREPEPSVADNEVNEIEIAIPIKTIDEYLQEAYTNGDDPGIVKDETTGIQFVDFSDSFKH